MAENLNDEHSDSRQIMEELAERAERAGFSRTIIQSLLDGKAGHADFIRQLYEEFHLTPIWNGISEFPLEDQLTFLKLRVRMSLLFKANKTQHGGGAPRETSEMTDKAGEMDKT